VYRDVNEQRSAKHASQIIGAGEPEKYCGENEHNCVRKKEIIEAATAVADYADSPLSLFKVGFRVIFLRLLRRDLRAGFVDEVHICRCISVEKVDARIWSKTSRLTGVMRGNKYEVSGVDLNRRLTLNLKTERAAHHHDVFIWRMPVPRNSAARCEFLHDD